MNTHFSVSRVLIVSHDLTISGKNDVGNYHFHMAVCKSDCLPAIRSQIPIS